MKISARTRYGLRILMDVALHERDGAPRTIGAIAKSQGISAAFISRLAVPLRRAHLINSVRGISGGLSLARSPDNITILSIMEALDGPVSILKCLSKPKTCKRSQPCPVRDMWGDINLSIRSALGSFTLAKVLARVGTARDDLDYCI